MSDFIGLDGWPCEFAMSGFGAGLIQAIRAIPGAESLEAADVEGKARILFAVAEGGRDEELPRNRPASQKASEDELRKVAALAARLEAYVQAMHRPALEALSGEGPDVTAVARAMQATREQAECALSGLEVEGTPRGAPPKVEAGEVTAIAAGVFEHITGRRATFSTDPGTGKVIGEWPAFLSAVFAALFIRASVAAQVRAVSEKNASE